MQKKSSTDPSVLRPKKRGYKKYVVIGVVAILLIAFFALHRGSTSSSILQSAVVSTGNVIETVSVTGQVLPVAKADLAFEKSGVVSVINVKVGDQVKKGAILASLDSATDKASFASAQAKLADMTRSLRPEEFAVDQSQVTTARVTINNAQEDAINASRQGYVQAQGAVTNYADKFFNNSQSVNPTIAIDTQSQQFQISLNNERLAVSNSLTLWKADLDAQANTATAATTSAATMILLNNVTGYLNTIKSFMSDLSTTVNSLTTGNSSLPQSTIDANVATMNSAMSGLADALTTVTSAQTELANASTGLSTAENQFALDNAGSSQDAIAAQAAQVALTQAELNQDSIVSPIDGTVSLVSPNIGEFVPTGQVDFGVINESSYKIEAYVAEADIAKVAVGNSASVTLDAYGQNTFFPATVTMIDPAETVLDGVPTYKVTLLFNQDDARIRSGMTANTDISTHEVFNALNIPYRAVVMGNGSSTVRVLRADGKNYDSVPVVTGLKGSDGTIQIISGLTEGQRVVVDLKN